MSLKKELVLVLVIKLILFYGVLKYIFFENYLAKKFDNDQDKANYVAKNLYINKRSE